jgi:Fe-S-cluster containining protein
MNIVDIENTKNLKKINSFKELYKEAKKQFLAFIKVEKILKSGSWEEYGFSIDFPEDQLLLKNFLQIRFFEELSEATLDIEHIEHYLEEITDAFNFFITSFIILGKKYEELPLWIDCEFNKKKMEEAILNVKENNFRIYKVIEKTNSLCNLLKNRPWTQTHYLVSRFDFEKRLKEFWEEFNSYINYINLDLKTLYDLFSKKKSVNMFRLATNY